MEISIRKAATSDIADMFSVRGRTRENPLSIAQLDARGITPESMVTALAGGTMQGWVGEDAGTLVGFSLGHAAIGDEC